MSTRSRIGMLMPDGKVKSIYCHWDGYPEGVGVKLQKHYTDPKKIEELLELGDISSLGDHYDKDISTADWTKFDEPDKNKREELIKKSENCTVAYKDRGEDAPARIDKDISEFMSKLGNCGEEYVYLFEEDYTGAYRWHICESPWFCPLDTYLQEHSTKPDDESQDEKDMGIKIVQQLGLDDGAKLEFN